ncbi:MAG: TetR family transcriptional regulator [Actinobacteria bacterium]|nr:TetR family transcriptional regulator [Actinomycetota bacterium]
MDSNDSPRSSARQERRKAATRAKIQEAAEALFESHGYANTSIEDISEQADVAVRTVYMHFPSKASIMLDYFDRWLDAFSLAVRERPVDEPVFVTVREALAAMSAAGWIDRARPDAVKIYPIIEHLDSGSPDIAGHILQRWMREMALLAEDARGRGDYPADSLEPQARASAVFAAWFSAMAATRARTLSHDNVTLEQVDDAGLEVLRVMTAGNL